MANKPLANRQAPERKNLDELEILRVIISENPQLKQKVLKRIEEIQEEHNSGGTFKKAKKAKKGR